MFAFGLGYSARRIVRGPAIEASGTVRSAEAAEALRREGVEAFVFDGVHGDCRAGESLGAGAGDIDLRSAGAVGRSRASRVRAARSQLRPT